jgi:hypothetical protein
METRTRDTKIRGSIAIHAGLAMPCLIGERRMFGEFEVERDSRAGLLLRGPGMWPYRLPIGAVVGIGDLIQTRRTESLEHHPDARERSLGNHGPGMWAWSITSMRRIEVPVAGRLGWWDWEVPADVIPTLRYPITEQEIA